MRVCGPPAPPVRFENFWISAKLPLAGLVAIQNWYAYPAERRGVASAALMSCDRFTSTISPAENGCEGVTVTVLSPFESAIVPLTVPLERPKTRRLALVTDAGRSAVSNVTLTVVAAAANDR